MSDETIESINQWADETFGPCSRSAAITRAAEEMDEYRDAIKWGNKDIVEEAADVCITLYRLPGIREAINKKMQINRQRKWIVKDGVGQHIKEDKDGR